MYLLKVPFVSAVYYSNKRIFLLGKKINWYSFILDQFDKAILFRNPALLCNKPHAWIKPLLCSLFGKGMPVPSWSREGGEIRLTNC